MTDYVVGSKKVLFIPMCFSDEDCETAWQLGLVASDHTGDPFDYFDKLIDVNNEYFDHNSYGLMDMAATVTDYVTFDYTRSECGDATYGRVLPREKTKKS